MTERAVRPLTDFDLAELRHHWGDFYRIEYDKGWRAARKNGTGATLRADTTDDMFAALRADYAVARAESDARPE